MTYIFKTLDVNGDGFIDFEDFSNALPSSKRATLDLVEGSTQNPMENPKLHSSTGRINSASSEYFPTEKEIVAKQK